MSATKTLLIASIATLATRIAADTEKHAKLTVQLEQFDLLDAVTSGTQVEFKVGRADTRRSVIGTVRLVKVEEDGSKKYKVEYSPSTVDGAYDAEAFDNTFAVLTQNLIDRVHADEHGNLC